MNTINTQINTILEEYRKTYRLERTPEQISNSINVEVFLRKAVRHALEAVQESTAEEIINKIKWELSDVLLVERDGRGHFDIAKYLKRLTKMLASYHLPRKGKE